MSDRQLGQASKPAPFARQKECSWSTTFTAGTLGRNGIVGGTGCGYVRAATTTSILASRIELFLSDGSQQRGGGSCCGTGYESQVLAQSYQTQCLLSIRLDKKRGIKRWR